MQLSASFTALSTLLFVLFTPIYVSAIPTGRRHAETTNDTDSALLLPSVNETLSARANTPPPAPPPIRVPIVSLPNQSVNDLTDKSFVGLVKLGDRGKPFKVIVDTGSADFWVPSETSTTLGAHSGIGPRSSTSLQVSATPFTVAYEDGTRIAGRVGADTLTFGSVSVPAVPVGVASTVQGLMVGTKADGILGLASNLKSRMGQHTVLETLAARGAIPAPIVGLKLGRLADKSNGEVSLGAPNFSKFNAQTQAASVNTRRDGLWGARIARITVNGQRIPITSAIFDSGAQAITAPTPAGGQFNHAIPGVLQELQSDGTTLSIIPCNSAATLASVIVVTIGQQTFQMQARDLVGPFVQKIQDANYCLSLVQDSRSRTQGEWIFGIPFLKNVYSIYDQARNTVTIARLA
ncbi:acid protease [Dentipellis sp. KUC8613]|nr:acid protease [Dentipellis sp. KUC8613]